MLSMQAADRFYVRYKITFPAAVDPSDFVVSRLVNEIKKRLLSMQAVYRWTFVKDFTL